MTCTAEVFSTYNGTLSKRVPNPSSFIFDHNNASYIVSAAATSSSSTMGCAVSPCRPTLARKTRYEDIDLPLFGFLLQFTSENAVSLKCPCFYVVAKPVVPAR